MTIFKYLYQKGNLNAVKRCNQDAKITFIQSTQLQLTFFNLQFSKLALKSFYLTLEWRKFQCRSTNSVIERSKTAERRLKVFLSGRRDSEDGGHRPGDREGGRVHRRGDVQWGSVLHRTAVQHGCHR